ncbi:AAA family ATPase [uncultured Maritalea sp.]|uniref:AAA family ATPase n=1 Tax=uncultured Maritalea sp. TaxID=757249 RepID=UPI00261E88C8|nr:AAA family ATPase [uncultured Maritalea sp.]
MSSGIVISFATEKGGSKKTTQNQIVAEIFANEGYSVNVLDFDPQGTMAKWIERRNDLIDENKENEGIDIPKIHHSRCRHGRS